MTEIKRSINTEETLELLPCPFCGDEVIATDCGYNTFNPGLAYCKGCLRKWMLGLVDDGWQAGLLWNKLQPKAKEIEELNNRLKELERQD